MEIVEHATELKPKEAHIMTPEEALEVLYDMVTEFRSLLNCCSVDFIVDNLFLEALSPTLQKELIALDDVQVAGLPGLLLGAEEAEYGVTLGCLLTRLKASSLEAMHLTKEATGNVSLLDHFDKIMPAKKTHEVARMFTAVVEGARKTGCSAVVDLGSGKGYLSQAVSALGNLPVLAVEGEEGNSSGAAERGAKLGVKWTGLRTRAEERREGKDVSNRKSRKGVPRHGKSAEGEKVVHVTRYVEVGEDCSALVREYLGLDDTFCITGLHTCGDLASTSLKAMVASVGAGFLCNVGCCYHLLTERFYSHPSLSQQASKGQDSGFPLSTILIARKAWLGRSARMLAAQPLSRLAATPCLPPVSLLWRAALQELFRLHAPDLAAKQVVVGKRAGKATSFPEYAKIAFQSLGQKIDIEDGELSKWFKIQEEEHAKKLAAFHQFRALFAPLVENVILLDRLCYLREQDELMDCSIVQLFDQALSPRAYALQASRSGSPQGTSL